MSRADKKEHRSKTKAKQWKWLLVCLVFNFGILVVVKYTNFTIHNINILLNSFGSDRKLSFLSIALPMGISFYTFKTMGYIIDVYRKKYRAEKNFFKLALFVSFFPQLIQGPISRYDNLSKTLFKGHKFNSKQVGYGVQRIIWGYFKKLVLADRILIAVNTLVGDPDLYQGGYVFVGMLFYAYQLYADFTGGIDITIGIGQVLGVEMEENFNRPYFSKSIAEYWRRWHITMGTWFKDYLFYPISVSKPMLNLSKFSRKKFGNVLGKRIPIYLSTSLVWFTTGLWHGSSWNFIVWGLTNCFVILLSQEFRPFYDWFHSKFKVKDKLSFRIFQIVRTVLLMSSIRMFDCYRDVPMTFKMFGTMFYKFNIRQLFNGTLLKIGLSAADYLILFAGLIVLTTVSILQARGSVRERLDNRPIVRNAFYYTLIICIIIFGAYGVGYDSSQFIYNQF
jgi:D-alanyl-lipoteichoic acid acyltransferase DltB (MBOAT superfamily)